MAELGRAQHWANPADDRLAGLAASFAAGARSRGESEQLLCLAGLDVRLRFAGTAMRARLLPALAHLAQPASSETATPALTIYLWDSATTGAPPPPLPPVGEAYAAGSPGSLTTDFFAEGATPATPGQVHATGPLYYVEDPPLRAAYYPDLEALSTVDFERNEAFYWVGDASAQAYWQEASPARQIFQWFLTTKGVFHIHGSSVGTETGGVLAVGKGGSGKSTVALASLGSSLSYAGDDYVGVRLSPSPRVESLYSSGKLNPPHVRSHLPELVPLLANSERLESEKAVVYVHQHFPSQTTRGYPLRAVLIPRVRADRTETRVVPASRGEALAALAPSTILQIHPPEPAALVAMSQLVARVPCYGLELGSDVATIPAAITQLLATLPAS